MKHTEELLLGYPDIVPRKDLTCAVCAKVHVYIVHNRMAGSCLKIQICLQLGILIYIAILSTKNMGLNGNIFYCYQNSVSLTENKTQYEYNFFFSFFLNICSDVGHLVKFSGPVPSSALHMTLDE